MDVYKAVFNPDPRQIPVVKNQFDAEFGAGEFDRIIGPYFDGDALYNIFTAPFNKHIVWFLNRITLNSALSSGEDVHGLPIEEELVDTRPCPDCGLTISLHELLPKCLRCTTQELKSSRPVFLDS